MNKKTLHQKIGHWKRIGTELMGKTARIGGGAIASVVVTLMLIHGFAGDGPRIRGGYEAPSVEEFKANPERALKEMKLTGSSFPEPKWEVIHFEGVGEVIKLTENKEEDRRTGSRKKDYFEESAIRNEWGDYAVVEVGRHLYLAPTEEKREIEPSPEEAAQFQQVIEVFMSADPGKEGEKVDVSKLPSTLFGHPVEYEFDDNENMGIHTLMIRLSGNPNLQKITRKVLAQVEVVDAVSNDWHRRDFPFLERLEADKVATVGTLRIGHATMGNGRFNLITSKPPHFGKAGLEQRPHVGEIYLSTNKGIWQK